MRSVKIDLAKPKKLNFPICACIGYFDGMHLGHQALIAQTRLLAEKYNCETAMITFDPDPWVTIRGIDPSTVQHITTMRQRTNLAVEYGIENIFTLNFTKEMSNLSPEDFIEKVLGQLNLKGLVCGFDFHFGSMGKGNPEFLKQHVDFDVEVVEQVADNLGKISSTRISELLMNGQMREATTLLGHPFEMEGKVVSGRHKGTGIGFPTANIHVSNEYLIPRIGVYACYAYVQGKKYKAMVNLGHNPTMNYTDALSLECHILDFNQEIYGTRVIVQFIEWIRPEIKFKNVDNLIMQLEQDVRTVSRIL